MKRYLMIYVITLVIFCAVDFTWLGIVAAPAYKAALGDVMLTTPRPAPAILFYLLQIAGMMVFVVPRGANEGLGRVALFGALYGFFTYTTFDLTNLAVLRPWTSFLAVTDIAWGTVLTCVASVAGVWAGEALTK